MKRLVPDFWEVHCVECGAPACYATCEKYRKGTGGLCQRIENGRFLPWGKFELFWQGRLATSGVVRLLRFVFGALKGLPRLIGGMNFRGLRRKVSGLIGRRYDGPLVWEIVCQAEYEEELVAAVTNAKAEEIMIRRLAVKPGLNEWKINLPRIEPKSYVRIYSIEGTRGRVEFKQCELGMASAESAKFVKCVVWDLDNTLWTGILANDGEGGVRLRDDVVTVIKALDQRGILNTICSKNDFEPACRALKKFGILDYFVFPEINWDPKSENIKRIAKNINIGLDTLAFVDDSEHERGEVAENLPMVRVLDERSALGILSHTEFSPPVSAESAQRRFSYLAEMVRRKDERETGGTHEDFLRKCEIKMSLTSLDSDDVRKRCWELVNRTNQLTLAAHRYTEEEFGNLVQTADCRAIKCRDKYGDYGVVGFVAIASGEVREFVMSCRVAKKCCEQSVLLHLADRLKVQGIAMLTARVISTGRNAALIDAFDAMPFDKKTVDGEILYELPLSADWGSVFRNEVFE